MKRIFSILIAAVMLSSCGNNESKTVGDAKELAAGINQMQPDGTPTTAGGWTMTAKFDGKDWSANSIMPLEATGRIIGDNNGVSISLPYDRREMTLGYKNKFGDHNAVTILINDSPKMWDGIAGEMEITKVDGDWVEGKFIVTGSNSSAPDKKIEITDGFFRISLAEKK